VGAVGVGKVVEMGTGPWEQADKNISATNRMLQLLWTKAVGAPAYDKREWEAFAAGLNEMARGLMMFKPKQVDLSTLEFVAPKSETDEPTEPLSPISPLP
jgi:hypothetical protein